MFDECSLLIPCTTLEDFPTQANEADARGLLAAWTAPWHPRWLATLGKLPQWLRADTIPSKLDSAVLLVPGASEKRLPSRFAAETSAVPNCRVFRGACRADFLAQMAAHLGEQAQPWEQSLAGAERTVDVSDFYALGYVWLQVQLMTRRLRYTSNLDEIHFSGRAIAAANAFVAGQADTAIAALHEAYDVLAEERDHYFSADPNLVDLTLLAPTTLGGSLQRSLARVGAANEPAINVLVGPSLAVQIAERSSEPDSPCRQLLQLIKDQTVGLAGAGPDPAVDLHHQTAVSARREIFAARDAQARSLGCGCSVFARGSGETPGDIGPLLAEAGFRGAIPIDLAAGSGWKDEPKLIWQSGAGDLDVLVSRPIDAAGSVDFLSLAPKLGQSIDSGEIATALLVHWPDDESDAYRDLRRAASWGLALGRFRKIDDYFSGGERPFHHFRGRADEGAGNWLARVVTDNLVDPLSSAARGYLRHVVGEAADTVAALAILVDPEQAVGDLSVGDSPEQSLVVAAERLCVVLGGKPLTPGAASGRAKGVMVINPYSIGQRVQASLPGGPRVPKPRSSAAQAPRAGAEPRPIFGGSRAPDGRCDVTADVAAGGFLFVDGSGSLPRRNWFRRSRRLAEGTRLSNEFMEVEISPKTGGVQGIYSGKQRGNRFSLRLVHRGVGGSASADGELEFDPMVADAIEVVRGDQAVGEVVTRGRLLGPDGGRVAAFEARYRLRRGSRWLEASTRLELDPSVNLGADPWRSYFAWRSAVSADMLNLSAPLRDMLQRVGNGNGNRIDAPAGLLIDEVDRQTLLYPEGRPAHLRVGDRFLDSLLIVRGESQREFGMAIGLDVPEPLTALRAAACPPPQVVIESWPPLGFGWLVNCNAPDVTIVDLRVESTRPLVLSMRVITTTSDSRKVRLRFCRDCRAAQRQTGNPHLPWQDVKHEAGHVDLPMAGHEAIPLRIELAD